MRRDFSVLLFTVKKGLDPTRISGVASFRVESKESKTARCVSSLLVVSAFVGKINNRFNFCMSVLKVFGP